MVAWKPGTYSIDDVDFTVEEIKTFGQQYGESVEFILSVIRITDNAINNMMREKS